MTNRIDNPVQRRWAIARRLFWATLLLTHLGALRSEWNALAALSGDGGWGTSILRSLALFASATFFVLKIADVRWLRLQPGWRSVVASLVVIGLLHLNVLERVTRTELSNGPAPLGIVLFVATLIESDRVRRALRRTPHCEYPRTRNASYAGCPVRPGSRPLDRDFCE